MIAFEKITVRNRRNRVKVNTFYHLLVNKIPILFENLKIREQKNIFGGLVCDKNKFYGVRRRV